MRSFEIRLPKPKKGRRVRIFPICCLHKGSTNHDKEKAEAYRDFILKTPDTYAASLGDDAENALPGDEKHNSMVWGSNMNPAEQMKAVREYWGPFVKKKKLLWTLDSNHWWRSEAKTGVSQAEQMNEFLNLKRPPRSREIHFGRWQALCRIHIGKQTYIIHSWHGAGGGVQPESALRKCRQKAAEHQADVYLMGHFHKKLVYEDCYKCWPPDSSTIVERKRVFGVTGAFLKWDEGYAERMGLPPVVRGSIVLELAADRWDVRVSL